MLFLWEVLGEAGPAAAGSWVCTFREGPREECLRFYKSQPWYDREFCLLAIVPDKEVPDLLNGLGLSRQEIQSVRYSTKLKLHQHLFAPFIYLEGQPAPTPGPRKPPPVLKPEVWQTALPTPERAWNAVRSLCAPFAPKGE